LRRRSDLRLVPIGGSLDGLLARLSAGDLDGIVLSAAALYWMDRLDLVTEYFDTDQLIPAPGQGALAAEVRADDHATAELMAPLHAEHTAYAVLAERTCRSRLSGPGDAPVGIFATTDGHTMFIHGIVATPDGSRAARLRWSGPWREADDVGSTLAELLLAIGAREILSGKPIPPTTRYAMRRALSDESWTAPYPEEEA
jgi:hydroxymethylbilane synthase